MDWKILARNSKVTMTWAMELNAAQKKMEGLFKNRSQLVLLDAKHPKITEELGRVNRNSHSIILIIEAEAPLPDLSILNQVDDLLVHPFRSVELLNIFRHHFERIKNRESLSEVHLAQKEIDGANEFLESVVKAKTPKRYAHIKGLKVMSKHLSGLKPGGDYFDVFESSKKDFVNLLLVDSSNYGISAALLGLILSSSARIANDAQFSTADWVKTIYEELKTTLSDQGHFSIFFGRLNRRDFSLHYQLYGSIGAFIQAPNQKYALLEKVNSPIDSKSPPTGDTEKTVQLNPKDRIVLVSDGFINGTGGESALQKILQERRDQEPFAVVNELSFQIKSKLNPGDTFPGEDCSAIVIDIDQGVLRLAPTG